MDEVILIICRYLYFYSLKTIVSKPYKYIFCANDISTSQVDNDSTLYTVFREGGRAVALNLMTAYL